MKGVLYNGENDYPTLTWKTLEEVHSKYLIEEPRDAMYKISSRLVEENWDDLTELSNSIGVLLLTWNSAFYRYGSFDYDRIQSSLVKHKDKFDEFRQRDILSLADNEKEAIGRIYQDMLLSLAAKGRNCRKNEGKVAYSPVSAGKALHLMCPSFFPLWDDSIAKAYGCKWASTECSFENYWQFMMKSLKQVVGLSKQGDSSFALRNLTVLKLIDEYNYVSFTKKKCP
jgi:hypothetical protein